MLFRSVRNLFKRFRRNKNGKTEKTEKEEQSEADVSTPKARDEKESRAPTTPEKESITQKSPSPVTQPLLLPAISSNQKIEQKLLPLKKEEDIDNTKNKAKDGITKPRKKVIAQPAFSKDERVLDVKRRMAEVEFQIEELEKLKI